jgi:RNA polymerase sigma-70 factor (ECF subfamily)
MTTDGYVIPHTADEASAERAQDALMDEASFQAFYRRHGRALWSYLCRMVIDQWRKRTREQQALDQFAPALTSSSSHSAPAGAGAGAALEGQGLSIDMARTFSELKPRERALLWLAYVEGSEHDEIASSLGLKPKSIRVLLFRARHRLAGLLKKKGLGAGS